MKWITKFICPDCGCEISPEYSTCPECGAPIILPRLQSIPGYDDHTASGLLEED